MVRPYFAALPPYGLDVSREVIRKVDAWYDGLPSLRAYQRARRNHNWYLGLPSESSPFDVSIVGAGGEAGELSQVHINRFHQLGQRLLSQAVQEEFGWQPQAANGDSASQEDALIATSVLEYEKRDKRLDEYLSRAAELGLVHGESWTLVRWDSKGGKLFEKVKDPRSGATIEAYEGRLLVTVHPMYRVAVDVTRRDPEHNWVIITEFVNKYDLAAKYPEHAERIVRLQPDHRSLCDWRTSTGRRQEDNDNIPVYLFFHRATPAVPEGREVVVADASLPPLHDGTSSYGPDLPCIRFAPGEMLDTPHGSTPLTHLGALQQVLNMLASSAVTNNANGAVVNIWAPAASNLSVMDLEGGQKLWQTEDTAEPKAINFAQTAPDTYNLMDRIDSMLTEMAGLNDVSMGKADPQLSGAAMALLDSKTLEAMGPTIKAGQRWIAGVGTAILDRYKRFAKTPRTLEVIVGNGRKRMLEKFTGAQLSSISRVTVKPKSPLTDTVAGKLDLAQKLMEIGAIHGPADAPKLISVLQTGQWETILAGPQSRQLLIQEENEKLREGISVPVSPIDNHLEHILGHQEVDANMEFRLADDGARAAVLYEHIQGHIDALRNVDPALLLALGQQPISIPPTPAIMQGAAPVPGAPPEAAPPMDGPPMSEGLDPAAGEPEQPGMPQMPIVAGTNERAPAPPVAA